MTGWTRAAMEFSPFVRKVADSLIGELPELGTRLVERIVTEDAFYAEVAAVFADEVRQSVDENLGQLVRGLAGNEELDMELPRQLAHKRAEQGVPVVALLHAYRLAAEVVWEQLITAGHEWAGRDDLDVDEVLDGAAEIWSLTNLYCGIISEVYDETVIDRTRRSERRRMLLLDGLLDGRSTEPALVAEAADTLDLPLEGALVVVVVEPPAGGTDPVRSLEQELRMAGVRSAWRVRTHEQVGIVALERTSGETLCLGDLREAIQAVVTGRAGVSPVFHQLQDVDPNLGFAHIAVRCVAPGGAGVALYDEHPVATLVAGAPAAAMRMAQMVLGSVLHSPRGDGEVLLETLASWIDEGFSATRASARLFCHRNTVRNRLQRIEELIGRPLDDPHVRVELSVAVTAATLLPEVRDDAPAPD